MKQSLRNIFHLGIKEIIGLLRDPLMMGLIIFNFTVNIYSGAKSAPDAIQDAAIAIVDEDQSALSKRLSDAFLPPLFRRPEYLSRPDIDGAMDRGEYTFIVVFPPNFQERVLAGHNPQIQINVDATRMSQAFTGNGYIQSILYREVDAFLKERSAGTSYTAEALIRRRFNPNLYKFWEEAENTLVSNVCMLAMILTGAALIRERERGTLEHLLVMPVTPFEIMVSKIWSMTLVVLLASMGSLWLVIKGWLDIPIAGSAWLFMFAAFMTLFAMTSFGIFIACYARDMPQLGILMILVLMPMEILSGGSTPQSSMPELLQYIMQISPTTHFMNLCRAIITRGSGWSIVWPHILKLFIIGSVLFAVALGRFRKMVAS